ncbi:MAG: hypothetical protein KF814_01645 [Nitrospiraceae bacterium]|nr:hypothetical protein [Nitrospiraceae bacterium]
MKRRWKRRLHFGEIVVVLSVVTALLALGLAMFLRSYYVHDLKGYQPLDLMRGKQLEQKPGSSSTGSSAQTK